MTETILALIILALLIFIGWLVYEFKVERKQLINAIVAKTPEQLRDLDIANKVEIKTGPSIPNTPDLIPMDSMDDEAFDEHIKQQLDNS